MREVDIGLSRTFKLGHWTPVRITLDGGPAGLDATLELTTADGDGVPVLYGAGEPAQVAAGRQKLINGYVRFAGRNATLTVQLTNADGLLERWEYSVPEMATAEAATAEWILTIGESLGINDLARLELRNSPEGIVATHVDQAATLPDHWSGYESIDLIVLPLSDLKLLESLSDQQATALERAVRMGGRILVCAGTQAPALSASERFAWLVPGKVEETVTVRRASALESYSSAMHPLVRGGRAVNIPLAAVESPEGVVEFTESVPGRGSFPVVIRDTVSFGYLVFIGFELDRDPFADWKSRPRLLAKLLQILSAQDGEQGRSTENGELSHIGYQDLAGQLRGSLDQFPGVTLVAFSWVAVLLVAYILLIGPGDFFLLRRIRRMHWSWVTFPLVVIVFSGLAWYGSTQFKMNSVRYNQVDVVDLDLTSRMVRGTSWTHIYSPQSDRFNLGQPSVHRLAASKHQEALLVWQGLPGKGLGGLNSSASTAIASRPYRLANVNAATRSNIEGLPITVSGTKSLTSRWWTMVEGRTPGDLYVEYESGRLKGTFSNPAPVALTDVMLLFADRVFVLDRELAAGETVGMSDFPTPKLLEWRLTRRRVVEQEAISTKWDERRLDNVPRLLEIMMFHRAAGGRDYTRLSHRYQAYLDLSDHLWLNRAILVARSKEPGEQLTRSGQSQEEHYARQWTFYRAVLPVRPANPAAASTR